MAKTSASLLRRIGRLPEDKALDIARQLCAGLSAAHTKGVLHRDLKPANIMLDGRGQVVITDFGLAGVADQIQGAEVRSGTPAYMAPEQLSGKEVSTRSDIFSLGLVLYEIFTGKRAFAPKIGGKPPSDGDREISRPSSVVKDLNPVIERVILRCLETEPSARPANVLSVAAALPGGDPLAAALAAGETPSPQLVAASGETAGLRPRVAVICLAAFLLALGLNTFLDIHYSPVDKIHPELTPEVLTQRTHEMISRFGYPERPLDSGYGLHYDNDFQEYVEQHDKPRPDWDAVLAGRPSILTYWYRQSPDYMIPNDLHDWFSPGVLDQGTPPPTLSGMISVDLDTQGQLIHFEAIPPQKESAGGPAPAVDWNVLFAAAGLDAAQFQKAEPEWNSLADSDTRMAWTGTMPGSARPIRIEAGARRGKPVFFSIIGEWTKPDRVKTPEGSTAKKIFGRLGLLIVLAALVGAIILARRNFRRARGDREGAFRLASVMFVLEILLWLCHGHLVPNPLTFFLLMVTVSVGLFVSGLTWVMYMALEPWVRRRWPQAIIAWSRLLSGQFRDPLVGRDILFGVMLGMGWIVLFQIRYVFLSRLGASPDLGSAAFLMGGRVALGSWLKQIPNSILATLQFFFLLFGLKSLLRKDWLAAIVFVGIFALPQGLSGSYVEVELPAMILVYAVAVLIVYRFGLVPLACAVFTINMLGNLPVSADFTAWYMTPTILALLSVVALAGWGFYHSLGGEPLWRPEEGD